MHGPAHDHSFRYLQSLKNGSSNPQCTIGISWVRQRSRYVLQAFFTHSSYTCRMTIFSWVHRHPIGNAIVLVVDHSFLEQGSISYAHQSSLTYTILSCALSLPFFERELFELPSAYLNWFGILFCPSNVPSIYCRCILILPVTILHIILSIYLLFI